MDSSTFAALIVGIIIFFILFIVLRALMLWYWKVDVIVNKLGSIEQLLQLQNETQRKQARINYYCAKATGDNWLAYESLLKIIIEDLLKPGITNEQRQKLYDELKVKHAATCERFGYSFPDYDLLF
jgi:hypothetical protein